MKRTLYLGLNPKNFPHQGPLIHYPVIRTIRIEGNLLQQALSLWPQFTHFLVTSQSVVEHWPGLWDKPAIAIGQATAKALQTKGCISRVASQETQEGMIALLQKIDLKGVFLFLPRSKKARPLLSDFLERQKIRFFGLDLYDTVYQRLEPVPDLQEIDQIVFTSPSTVEGFLKIYGTLPKGKELIAIGPITEKVLWDKK